MSASPRDPRHASAPTGSGPWPPPARSSERSRAVPGGAALRTTAAALAVVAAALSASGCGRDGEADAAMRTLADENRQFRESVESLKAEVAAERARAARAEEALAEIRRASPGGASPSAAVLAYISGAADPRPAPAYTLFEGITFEPSAVAYDAPAERVLAFSDKDAILYRYRLAGGRLELPREERHRALRLAGDALALKVEGVTPLASGEFLATTSFDRHDAEFRHLFRFRFSKVGSVETNAVPFDPERVSERLRALDPEIAWWKVEGLAVTAGETAALLGVRSVGRDFRRKRDVVWVVRCPRAGASISEGLGAPDLVVRFDAKATPSVGREEGVSSLERDPASGDYFMLTSWEDRDDDPAGHDAHLFRLGREVFEGPAAVPGADPAPRPLPRELRDFRAKAEGLAFLPGGRLLVVFDDDQDWKRLFRGYEQSQGQFTVLEPADLAPPAPPSSPGAR
jgi:hypothetical protein